jgi:hypothetical protein
MGLDFIRRATGKPFRKSWKDGLDRLTLPTLFPVAVDSSRVVTAHLLPQRKTTPGQDVIIQIQDTALSVCEGNQPLAIVDKPPTSILSAIVNAAGIALGTIERIGTFGDTVEVRIR